MAPWPAPGRRGRRRGDYGFFASSFFGAAAAASFLALANFFSQSALATSSLAIFRQSALVSLTFFSVFSAFCSALGASAGLAAGAWAAAKPARPSENAMLTTSAI